MRPTWDELFIKIAQEVAERSTCIRMKVGAVVVQDNRIVSIGYNGSTPGGEHCGDHFRKYYISMSDLEGEFEDWIQSQEFYDMHYKWSAVHEIHAEQNAILYAAKKGISTEGATLYVTHSPCKYCAKTIVASGIKHVKFLEVYDREKSIDFLKQAGVECEQISL